ncbi:MAG: hypothetical protein AAB214_08995 [Fibrobacterota bacterium]
MTTTSPFTPLETLVVDLPFRLSLTQRILLALTSPLGRWLPIPRESEIALLAQSVLPHPPGNLPRQLFRNALRESALLLTGGWNRLDLTPLSQISSNWTQTGRPALFLSMHHGNWEWLAGILFHLRPDCIGVARAAHQRPGQLLLEHVRRFHKTPVLYNQTGVRAAHKTLRRNGLVAFLADQRPPTQGVPGTWMGHSTQVTPLPRLWCEGITPEVWTGTLLPGRSSYQLRLQRYPAEVIAHWDLLLDQDFRPLIEATPSWHFGFFHKRLFHVEQ